MLNEIKVFNNNEFGQVRIIEVDSKPYFVGRDIAEALGYSIPHKAIQTHCKGVLKRNILTDGGSQEMLIIPEGDIYRLIVKSQLPSAEKFEEWVFDEVLPSIRKHGMYATQELLDNPDLLIQVATALKEERAKNLELTHEVEVKAQVIGELKPKADYLDRILKNPGLMTITQIAKDYGMSGQAMNALLHSRGIQYKQSGQWLLYKEYQSMGYTHSETVEITRTGDIPGTKLNTKWTQKGRLFIYNLLKEDGIVPTIEKTA